MTKDEHHFASGGKPIKERHILFSGPMVRAIFEGKKSQTRRIVKPQPDICRPGSIPGDGIIGRSTPADKQFGRLGEVISCPYGEPSDRLWVRETWQGPLLEESETNAAIDWYGPSHIEKYKSPAHCVYRADEGPTPEYLDIEDNLRQGWKPSIHMPRWASRILLEITNVRVERLQDISEEDALSEGILFLRTREWEMKHFPEWRAMRDSIRAPEEKPPIGPSPKQCFKELWNEIYGPGSWDASPWVWVIEFKVIPNVAA